MQIGMIGLGRMGMSLVGRLLGDGHTCVVHDRSAQAVQRAVALGATGALALQQFVERLQPPRAVWLMLPAAAVDAVLMQLMPLLQPGDLVVDGGNSRFQDDLRRATLLQPLGISLLDVGTSGGVAGQTRGFCLMVGGEPASVKRMEPVFDSLAPGVHAAAPTPGRPAGAGTAERGWLHCGRHGAGHFVKMVHNGIEYAVMAGLAEGLNLLHRANAGELQGVIDAETAPLLHADDYHYPFDVAEIAEVWRRGSVISSWLLDLTAAALAADPALTGYAGRIADSGEGRWTVQAAIDLAVPLPVISSALYGRFSSRGVDDFANRVQSAMRHDFGGHPEPPPSRMP